MSTPPPGSPRLVALSLHQPRQARCREPGGGCRAAEQGFVTGAYDVSLRDKLNP